MLSPYLIKCKDAQRIVVIRHPADQPPSGLRHDVVAVIGTLPRLHRAAQLPEIVRLMAEAAAWIETAPPENGLEPAAGFSAIDRLKRTKATHAQSRRERAGLIRALRKAVPLDEVIATHGKNRVAKALQTHKRLYARYGKVPRTPVPRRMPPTSRQLRQTLELARDAAERQAAQDEANCLYWQGQSALARELLALWQPGEADAE